MNIVSIAKKIFVGVGILGLLVPVGFVGKTFPDKALAAGETSAVTKTPPATAKVVPLTPKLTQLKVKSGVKTNEIDLVWNPQKLATKFLVQWGIEGQRNIFLKVTTKDRVVLSNLLPNTNYEIKVSAFDIKGRQIAEKSLSLKTLAAPRVKAVAGVQTSTIQVTPQVTPSIGTGASTRTSQVTPKTAKVSSPAPSPSPQESNAPKEKEKTGWSRILVALAILIVAAGAAIGGYYGYEWYAGRHEDGDSSDSKSSRW